VVSFIEKYHPNLVNNLVPYVSPMIATTKVVRQIYGSECKIVYIGSNLACKNEAILYSKDAKIDAVLIFPELRKLFTELEIDENTVEFSEFDLPLGYKGSLYPLSNGLIQAADIDENLLTTHVLSVEGKDAMIESIDEFENNVKVIHRHLHVTFGNMIAGPGITNKGNKLLKEHLVIKYANKRLMNFFRAEWYDNLQKYLQLDFSRSFRADDQRIPEPTNEEIKKALEELKRGEDEIHDCSSCGYPSCKAFATDMAKGIVIPEMCSTYAVRNSKYYSDNLRELNEKLASTRRALKEAEEKSFTEHDSAKKASDLANAMLENLRAGIVIVDYKLKVVKANTALVRMLGEEASEINSVIPGLVGADLKKLLPQEVTNLFSYVINNSEPVDGRDVRFGQSHLNVSIFPIRTNQIAGGIIRDMRAPEVQKSEVMGRISEVIDKNLEMVQKIGFLLGEGASDIEKMLNSIIEFYKDDSK
jgi:PAS domain-containing protein